REALKLVPRLDSYDGMLAVTRFYVGGFKDQHFSYSDNLRNDSTPMYVNGWLVNNDKGVYRVVAVAPNWPSALPPLGARLLACDGQQLEMIFRERVLPFMNWRSEHANGVFAGSDLLHLRLKGTALSKCEFQLNDNNRIELPISYQAINGEQYFGWFIAPQMRESRKRENSYQIQNGVLWIRAGNFSPSPEQVAALEALLAKLKTLRQFEAIVFDVRGNGGGNSAIGERIFEAATGGLEYDIANLDQLPRTFAQWRATPAALKALTERYDETVRIYGKDSRDANWASALVSDMRAAIEAKRPWVEQVGGPRVTRADVASRGGKLREFSGKIALLTDAQCFSACLDFADTVLKVPGALHVGETTSADAVYIDGWRMFLPSGNVLAFPMKVWRNRIRGNNETLRPAVEIALDTLDEAEVYSTTVAALQKATR
ncbi:MAG: S41 family peptidase, partial [Casimicrobium sp.]